MLVFRGRIYLPQGYITKVIREYHDNPLQGHLGVTKILEIIEKSYARPKLRESVVEYIKKYIQCQQNKVLRHKKYS